MPRTRDRDEDIRAATAAIFRQFEAWIREAPEQWLWFNTRFEGPAALEDAAPRTAADLSFSSRLVGLKALACLA
jgi:lauroyl/myristoyl acyltransferase